MKKFKIAFFGSSAFVVPILDDLYKNQDSSLWKIFDLQLSWLKTNQQLFFDIVPNLLNFSLIDYSSVKELLERPIELSLVVTQPDSYNHNKKISNPVLKFCSENNLSIFTPEKINKEIDSFKIKSQELDISVVASFGQIISQEILDIPKFGFINWHPSNLPNYRGATPMQTLLKNGDLETALSWIEMSSGMDSGDVLLKLKTRVLETENFPTLAHRMGFFGENTWAVAIVLNILSSFKKENYKLKQNPIDATFCKMLSKSDKILSIKDKTALEIYNQWRAYLSFPGTSFLDVYFNGEVKILQAKLDLKASKSSLEEHIVLFSDENWIQIRELKEAKTFLRCKNDTYLEIKEILLVSGKKINFSGFVFKS